MSRARRPVDSDAPTEIIAPPKKENGKFRAALSNWTHVEIVLLIALGICVIATSVVTIANGNQSAAESGLRGVTVLLAGALVGLKAKNGT